MSKNEAIMRLDLANERIAQLESELSALRDPKPMETAPRGALKMPAFNPVPAFLEVIGLSDDRATYTVALTADEVIGEDIDAMDDSNVVLMPIEIWEQIKGHLQ